MEFFIKWSGYLATAYFGLRFAVSWYYNWCLSTEDKEDDILATKLWNFVKAGGTAFKDAFDFKKGLK